LRRLRRRNEKYFLFALLASPEAGFADFSAAALKKAKLQGGGRGGMRESNPLAGYYQNNLLNRN